MMIGSGISRRGMLMLLAGTAFVAGGFTPARAEDQVLRVATYGGSYLDGVKKNMEIEFHKRTGATVEYVVGGPRQHFGKIVASKGSHPPIDVVDWPVDIQAEAIKQGLVEAFDPAAVPNAKLLEKEAFFHLGYAPTFQWVVSGIVYNRGKYKEAGVAEPANYEALADKRLAGHVALPEIANPVAPPFLAGLNQSLSGDVANIDPTLKLLAGIQDPIMFPNFAVLQTRFGSGEIWAFPGNQAYVPRLRSAGMDIAFARPKVGDRLAVAYASVMDVVKGTEVKKLADAWLDVVLSTPSQLGMAQSTGYAPTNREAAAELAKSDSTGDFMTSESEIAALYQPDFNKINAAFPEWIEKWNSTMRR